MIFFSSFLQIQQKEASRVKSDITRDPVQEKRLEMVKRMPQLARILRSYPTSLLSDHIIQGPSTYYH